MRRRQVAQRSVHVSCGGTVEAGFVHKDRRSRVDSESISFFDVDSIRALGCEDIHFCVDRIDIIHRCGSCVGTADDASLICRIADGGVGNDSEGISLHILKSTVGVQNGTLGKQTNAARRCVDTSQQNVGFIVRHQPDVSASSGDRRRGTHANPRRISHVLIRRFHIDGSGPGCGQVGSQ